MNRLRSEDLWISLRKGASTALHIGWANGGYTNNLTARDTKARIRDSGRVDLVLDLSHNLRPRHADFLQYDAEDVERNKEQLTRVEISDDYAIEKLSKVLTARNVQPNAWILHLRIRKTMSYACTVEYRKGDIVLHVESL